MEKFLPDSAQRRTAGIADGPPDQVLNMIFPIEHLPVLRVRSRLHSGHSVGCMDARNASHSAWPPSPGADMMIVTIRSLMPTAAYCW